MRCYRIKITSWISSFRYPNLISGYQPTLQVPPISTVLGVINACAGRYLDHKLLPLGYYFEYSARSIDLETIYQIGLKKEIKQNVIKREFLFENKLFIYLNNKEYIKYFRHPVYPLLLGRSTDLASVELVEEIELKEISSPTKIKGQIVPFNSCCLPGVIQALPKYFTNTIPRSNIGTEPYSVIPYNSADVPAPVKAYRDVIENKEVDIYFHELDFSKYL